MEKKYLECNCHDVSCVARFVWAIGDDDPDWQYLTLYLQKTRWLPWYKRVWESIKYIFGGHHGGWGEVMILEDEAHKMREIIDEYLDRNSEPVLDDAELKIICEKFPGKVAKWLENNRIDPAVLTFLAEKVGQMSNHRKIIQGLMSASHHESVLVREGAIYGLSHHVNKPTVMNRISAMASNDPSPTIRECADEAIKDYQESE